MAELVFWIIGAVISLGGLVLAYVQHRHQRWQARELAVRETALRARELDSERRDATLHASMLRVVVGKQPSPLDPSVTGWELTATNDSMQPFTGVVLCYGDQALAPAALNGLLSPGASVTEALPVNREEPDPVLCVVEFTDVAGRLWRRLATGDLHRGLSRDSDGEVIWETGEASYIHVAGIEWRGDVPGTDRSPNPFPVGKVIACAAVVVVAGAVALAVWYVFTR
ncbi:hypothetical protein [Streptomyces xylophagus]|uniref:hypothetical protein n=1 Tax=Streptomyces xylophagus TaxID=285514 RepID=UPI0005BE6911|nr:hypothetical protein [Streptomyces xylophagus]